MGFLRAVALFSAACVLSTAHAGDTSRSGTVALPAPTPSIARALFQQDASTNGWFGYVVPLPPSAGGRKYTLQRTAGATGMENLDAWFYSDLTAANPSSCRAKLTTDEGEVERGTICVPGGPVAAVLVMIWLGPDDAYGVSAGANASFTFTY